MTAPYSLKPALIAVDWGSTNLRAYLLDSAGGCLDREFSNEGVLNLTSSFSDVLERHVGHWLTIDTRLPIVMSGMIGSGGGWVEVSHTECPISADKLAKALYRVDNFNEGNCWIVPGVRAHSICNHVDLMRGEEVQIVGALLSIEVAGDARPDFLCLPGTHSKWVPLVQGAGEGSPVQTFSTAMTGELFSVLGRQSILSQSFSFGAAWNGQAFVSGLETSSRRGGLLHHLFSVRSRQLNGEMNKSESRAYLSGLLIGSEIQSMLQIDAGGEASSRAQQRITVVAATELASRYQAALRHFDLEACSISSETASQLGITHIARRAGLISGSENG